MTTKQKFAILLSLITVGAQLYSTVVLIIERGWLAFQYYTMDSNIFAAITSILMIFSLLSKGSVSQKIHNLRYYSTCCVTVTFIVVIAILIPLDGLENFASWLFEGTDFWLHTVGPLLNIASFLFLEHECKITKRETFLALIPTIIYAVIAIVLNLVKVIYGPYPFLHVYEQSIFMTFVWLIVISALVYGIALLLKFGNTKLQKNKA